MLSIQKILLSLSLFLVFGTINADDDSGACTDVKPDENFSTEKFAGTWFLYAVGRNNNEELALDCVQFIIATPLDDENLPIIKFSREIDGGTKHVQFHCGKLTKTGQGTGSTGRSYAVAGIQSDNWAVLIGCDISSTTRMVWIFTRDQNAHFLKLSGAYRILVGNKIKIGDLVQINQENCPNDWSDADQQEEDFTYEDAKSLFS